MAILGPEAAIKGPQDAEVPTTTGPVWQCRECWQVVYCDMNLTKREQQVLAYMAGGWNNQAIADFLHISKTSVGRIITVVYEELDIPESGVWDRRVKVVLWALKHLPDAVRLAAAAQPPDARDGWD